MLLFPPKNSEFKFPEALSPRLRIDTYSDAIRTLTLTGTTRTGLLHDTWDTTDTRSISTHRTQLTEIPLSLLLETSSAQVQRGRLFVKISLEYSGRPSILLAADYITLTSPISWPTLQQLSPTSLQGAILTLVPDPPAPGSNLSIIAPTNTLYRVLSVAFTLVTSATIAVREAIVLIRNPSTIPFIFSRPTNTQIQSLARSYTFANYNTPPTTFGTQIAGALPLFFIYEGQDIITDVQSIQADDQITDVTVMIEQWINP